MPNLSQHAQISSDWFNYFCNSTMLSMIVLDAIVALVILAAHRWFVLNERKVNAMLTAQIASAAAEKIEVRLPILLALPVALA